MPKPLPNEKEQEFIKRCIPQVVEDGTVPTGDNSRAFAVCQGLWNQSKGIKSEELEGFVKEKEAMEPKEMCNDPKKMKAIKTVELSPAHILSAGTWEAQTGRVKITEKDIDDIIDNFKKGIIEPVLNLDHDDKMTDKARNFLKVAALGYVKDLEKKVEGKTAKLFASFRQVPEKIAEMIKSGMIKQRSPEIFRMLKRGGQIYHNVLKAVSFFGRELPAGILDDYNVELFKMSTVHFDSDSEVFELKKQTEEKSMSDMTIPRSEYQDLVKAKSACDQFEIKFNNATATIEKLQAELVEANKEVDEAKKLKADIEKEKTELLKKEATDFIEIALKAGKILPKYKEQYVDDYMLKASDEAKLKLFKEDINDRQKVIELSDAKDISKDSDVELESSTDDHEEMSSRIEKLQAEKGITWEEAAAECGLNVETKKGGIT